MIGLFKAKGSGVGGGSTLILIYVLCEYNRHITHTHAHTNTLLYKLVKRNYNAEQVQMQAPIDTYSICTHKSKYINRSVVIKLKI